MASPFLGQKKDPAWEYCEETAVKGTVLCKFCKETIAGGVYRFKYHIARIKGQNVRICPKVTLDVERQFNAILSAQAQKKELKERTRGEIARVASNPPPSGGRGYEYSPLSPYPEEESASVSQSDIGGHRQPSMHSFLTPRGGVGRGGPSQTTLDAHWNKDKFITARKAVGRFWYYSDIPFNVAHSPYWEGMVDAIAACPGFKAPSYHDLRGPILEDAVEDVKLIINEQKKIWKTKGCSILTDGWTDRRGRTLINFLVSSSGGLVFLKSLDASAEIKNADYLYRIIREVIEEVGVENVVQVITDNASAYVAAGRMIEETFPTIVRTPCAAHCLDLLLEDIGKIQWVRDVVEKARSITRFIYSHTWVLDLMRSDWTNGKDLIRAGATRFATSFLSLQSVCDARPELKQMVVCTKWNASRFRTDVEANNIVEILFDDAFWQLGEEVVKITEPIVRVLRLVDSDKASMGYLYEAMDRAKEAIQSYYNNNAYRYRPIWDIIDRRWTSQLHRPIHAAGLYLNPKFFFRDGFNQTNEEINKGLHQTVKQLVTDPEIRERIFQKEIQNYKKALGYLFGSPECISGRSKIAPDLWWEDYGGNAPNLQKIAIKFLSQPCSSSGCERNWSTFENIHSKKRTKLTQQRLNDLVYVHYNLRLHHRKIQGALDDFEAIDLDAIDPGYTTEAATSDAFASWLRGPGIPEEVQDFDFTSEDRERFEQEVVAMAEEEERAVKARHDVEGSSASVAQSRVQRDDAPPPPPAYFTRRKGKERLPY